MKNMQLTEKEFFDYLKCPIHYDTIHNKHFSPPGVVSLSSLLGHVAASFYTGLLNGKILSPNDLKRRWDRLCETHSDYMTQQRCLDGMGQILKMYRWAEKEELRIADRTIPYVLTINGKHGITDFRGSIDTVAVNKDNSFYLLTLDFGNKYPTQSFLDMKLKLSLDSYAFNTVYNRCAGIKVHNVKHDKDFFSIRGNDDYARLCTAIDNVAYCVKEKIFYPRENAFCPSCDLIHFCRAWK